MATRNSVVQPVDLAAASPVSPMIVVDTVVGYGWMGIMIALAGFQKRFDTWNKADNRVIEDVNQQIGKLEKENARPIAVPQLLGMIGLSFGLAYVVRAFFAILPQGTVLNKTTWTIMTNSAIGIVFSFTRIRKLEDYGASKLGYAGIYL